ncbi:histone-lysine N-methyltransferase PRDM9-like isoform X3 [Epinephelus fuscoguttatus]|uniref:histone-lysine N-methyltransferase PRDM9-like isoform X3 n=1 Tax=Epinephelus fuscoguttatus TaxID=293821 RepID=UPI0020D0FA65|nr:histone-lysine N-methyltransferase PRDM9-like isoform X3 [Epinephelus fuscoguttatus]
MCSVESLREFVNQRLTAAAEEILGVFQRSIVEYEEEIDRQRRLLDMVLKPEIKLHRTELPQQHVCKEEEVVPEQQLCIEERKSSVEQEEPEAPEIKEEEEEVCSSQEGEQLVVKQETDGFMLTPADEESEQNEDQTLDFIHDDTQSAAEKESVFKMPVISSVISEATSEHQLLCHNSDVAERQDEEEYQHGDSGSTRNTELQAEKRHHESEMNSNSPHTSAVINLNTGKKPLKCDICGKVFEYKSKLQRHLNSHTDEKLFSCKTCGKRFSIKSVLKRHCRIHTGEKNPHTCKVCGRAFTRNCHLLVHMRTHTGEKPFACKVCGRGFVRNDYLLVHMRTHTGEMPYTCKTCGKHFRSRSNLTVHMRTHTGVKVRDLSTEVPVEVTHIQERDCLHAKHVAELSEACSIKHAKKSGE